MGKHAVIADSFEEKWPLYYDSALLESEIKIRSTQ